MRIHILSRHWKAKGAVSVSAKIRQRRSKKVKPAKVQRAQKP